MSKALVEFFMSKLGIFDIKSPILDIKTSNFGYQKFEFWISKIPILHDKNSTGNF
jgi:hypothetical protein